MILSLISVFVIIGCILGIRVVSEKYYPILIYVSALPLLYSTTLLGVHVVGSDIYAELLMTQLSMNGWNLLIFEPSNTSFVVGWLIPIVSKFTSLTPVWVYKIILPILFALCPTILYFAFKAQIGSKKAFYATMFFMIMPVFALEIATIGKMMVAEVFLALAILMLSIKGNPYARGFGLLVATLLSLWAHYTVGIILLIYLAGIVVIRIVALLFNKWKLWANRTMPIWLMSFILIFSAMSGFWYYSVAGNGFIVKEISFIADIYYKLGGKINNGDFELVSVIPAQIPDKQSSQSDVVMPKKETGEEKEKPKPITIKDTYLDKQPLLIRTALGLDFLEVGIEGKIFRIIQYITQLLIIIGCLWLLFNYKRYEFTTEFIAGIGTSFAILLMCIFIPAFASIINTTRFYHLSLFFLAPTLVLGCDAFGWKR